MADLEGEWTIMGGWPIEVQDAPILCGFCCEPVMGSGYGPISVLLGILTDHTSRCAHRPTCSNCKEPIPRGRRADQLCPGCDF